MHGKVRIIIPSSTNVLSPPGHSSSTLSSWFSFPSFPYIASYASSIPELQPSLSSITPPLPANVKASQVDASAYDDVTKDQILQLVLAPQYTFGTAAWFLDGGGECQQGTIERVQTGDLAAFISFVFSFFPCWFDINAATVTQGSA
jgi:hypothetical protein